PTVIVLWVVLAAMAHGVEVGGRFLDQDVMEPAAATPSRYKLYALQTKRILKEALADLVPREILTRSKRGFDPPVDDWLRGPLAELTRDLLLDATARRRGLFNQDEIGRMVTEHFDGGSHGLQLWTLLVLEQWCRTYLDSSPATSTSPH